jgi:H+/gluconate symporter-like permease
MTRIFSTMIIPTMFVVRIAIMTTSTIDHHDHDSSTTVIITITVMPPRRLFHDLTVESISLRAGADRTPERFFPWIEKITQIDGPNILQT